MDAASPKKGTGKTVLIVGGSSGIGEALAYKYAEKKWRVIVAARRESKLVAVVKNCESRGAPSAAYFVCDVTVRQQCINLINQATNNNALHLDLLIYCAGQAMHSLFADVRNVEDVMPRIMNVNFYGAVWITHAAYPVLQRSKGHLVVVSSVAGDISPPYVSFYTAAKHAVNGFFESLQNEEQGVTITIVCPGYVATEFDNKKILADGSVGNPELNTDVTKYSSAKSVAEQIYDAAKKRKTKAVLETVASLGVTIYGLFPGTINSAVKKEMKAIAPAEDAASGKAADSKEKGKADEKDKDRVQQP